jgi:hypothetical protein
MEQIPLADFQPVQQQRRLSRDEMNLAEFPLTVLSTRASASSEKGAQIKTLEFNDQIKGKNGEVINREWIITGADKFGLPTSSDDEVLLGLLKLTVDAGFLERKVYFSRYELLKILRWSTEGRSYQRLQRALDRLSGVRIRATNAFYDNESKSHSTKNFGLIDAYEINDGRALEHKPSYFVWSEALFKSYKVGFIKKFDLDFYLELQSAVSRRLFRYLDKHFWYKSRIQVSLFVLAHEKIGVSRNYQYASSLRQQLDPAFDELVQVGFLSKVEYLGKGRDCEVVIYAASAKPRVLSKNTTSVVSAGGEGDDAEESENYRDIAQLLVDRGIQEMQIRRLLEGKTEEAIARIREIISYFDTLCASGSKLISKNRVGFLYCAVRDPDKFVLPQEAAKRAQDGAQITLPLQQTNGQRRDIRREPIVQEKSREPSLEAEYLIARLKLIRKSTQELEPAVLGKIKKDVEHALVRMKGTISDSRFQEAVQVGVDNKIAKLFAVPEFDEWLQTRK